MIVFLFNCAIPVISVVLRETTLSASTGVSVSIESEIVRVASLRITEISETTRLKIRYSESGYLKFGIMRVNIIAIVYGWDWLVS